MLVWLRRMRHSRGFGIQSPRDYSFIRYVVNEHYPYYAYADLAKALPNISKRTRKLCELYFRISNYCQANIIVNCLPTEEAYSEYFHAGCHKSTIVDNLDDVDTIELLRVSVHQIDSTFVDKLLAKVNDKSLVIIEGIHHDKETRKTWRNVIKQEQVIISFDLYYTGILFFDNKRYKQHYIINF